MVSPSAYGLIVMIQVFISFSQLFIDSGFTNALIQKKNRTDADYYTVFIFNLVVSVVLYAILFVAAPLIADFYDDPRLTPITRVISLNLIISSLSLVQKCHLTIRLDFRTQAKVGLTAVIVSGGAGLFCAYSGMEVWALVIQSIFSQLLVSILLNVYSHWTPKLIFSYSSFKQLFSFGSRLLVGEIVTNIYLNLYNLIIAKFYSPADLGFYNRAFTLAQYPSTNICGILMRTIYPIECELQNQREKLIESYYKYIRFSCYIVFPLMILLAIQAKSLIIIILTEKWLPAGVLLSIMSCVFLFFPLLQNMLQILKVMGQVKVYLKSIVISRIASFLILIITFPFGMTALAGGIFTSTVIEVIIAAFFASKVLKIPFWRQFSIVGNIATASLLMGGVIFLLRLISSNDYIQLFASSFIGILIYIVLTYLFKMEERAIWQKIFSQLKLIKKA